MVDSCRVNLSDCLNNGKCLWNTFLNNTYCQCDSCHHGLFCEQEALNQSQFNTDLIYLIMYIILFGLSVLNNSLALEVFIRCKQIRSTNSGVYLIIYSIFSLLSIICLLVDRILRYYPNLTNDESKKIFDCFAAKIGYTLFVYLCIWFGAAVAFERGLIVRYASKMNAHRWRSVVTVTIIFAVAIGSVIPPLIFNCGWASRPNLQIARAVFIFFYPAVGIVIYILATLLILVSFTRRVREYSTGKGSFLKTYLKLLRSHLFIFVPPITYAVSYIPYTVANNVGNPDRAYFQCGISTAEYITKVLFDGLTNVPVAMTWLLFVYPSKVYITEFYLSTWSGKCCVRIWMALQSLRERKEEHSSTSSNRAG